MKKLILIIALTVTTHSHGQFFKCLDEKKHVHYQDQACAYEKGKLRAYQPSGQYESRDPIAVQNEIARLQNQANATTSYNSYQYYRPESNELIESQKRKEAESQARWDGLGRVGVTPYNSPATYGYTRYSNH